MAQCLDRHGCLTRNWCLLELLATRGLEKGWRLDSPVASAGWVTEGVSAFDELSGSPPVSIRQQALRGLAKIALERNDCVAAKAQYERILGKALMGRGPPAEHWAHSEYAWLVFEDGDLEVRRRVIFVLCKKCSAPMHWPHVMPNLPDT